MSMTYQDFLTKVIDEGIAEVRKHYTAEKDRHKLEGAEAGFELCRGKTPVVLLHELVKAREASRDAMSGTIEEGGDETLKSYWKLRYTELQVEWVLNVLSAGFLANGVQPLVPVTARGMMAAGRILGVTGQPAV